VKADNINRLIKWAEKRLFNWKGFILTCGGIALALQAIFWLTGVTCNTVKSVNASICIQSSKVKSLADTVAKARSDSLRYDVGEAITDMAISEHEDKMIIRAHVSDSTRAKLHAQFVEDSVHLISYYRALKLRR
jgi:hypothetical protein